ncbi:hypothetical protein RRG08_046473 [Elysia crispata]|uniref:Uncharacterized protein n=1 Tax=Elysia crispata TaxID=231223 RepID=A0AAE0YID0_9GAST|nr:hypothetical protein RRG08_046473 [Elysia crispata]
MVCITETWLSDSCPDSCVDLDGFSVFPLTSPLTPERREAVANSRQADDHITSLVHDQLNKSPDSIVLITCDFNHCTLGTSLPTLHQYVTCRTRNNKTLDVCYGNVKDGYQKFNFSPIRRLRSCYGAFDP